MISSAPWDSASARANFIFVPWDSALNFFAIGRSNSAAILLNAASSQRG